MSLNEKLATVIDTNAERWFRDYIVEECKRMAQAMFLPDKFVEGIDLRYHGHGRAAVVNTFGTPDVPLAKFFNYGTRRNYIIEPKVTHNKTVARLRSPRDKEDVGDKTKKVVHPEALKWDGPDGPVFARRVIHPGFPKTLAMEFGVETGKNFLKESLPKLIKDELE